MKRYLLLLIIPIVISACGPTEKEKKLQAKVDSLTQVTGEDSQTINEYLKAFNEIQANLDEIKDKESIINSRASGDSELGEADVDAINTDISAIYELMQENKEKLSYLKKKLRNSGKKMSEFQATIERLTLETEQKKQEIDNLRTELEAKDVHIAELTEEVDSLETDLSDLENENIEKEETIGEQDKALHRAYYVVGSMNELKEKEVVTTEGGFIGIGGVKKINEDTEGFTTIDIREVTEFDLNNARKVTVITSHPDEAYEFEMNGKEYSKLIVKDTLKFWKMSKYLVVSLK